MCAASHACVSSNVSELVSTKCVLGAVQRSRRRKWLCFVTLYLYYNMSPYGNMFIVLVYGKGTVSHRAKIDCIKAMSGFLGVSK